ncbi:MAG: MFS transporter [Chloroflexi bacterium]|nr:MFS transporter [Chloroflexota bacterium]
MLIAGIVLGLVMGLLAGGSFANLASIRLRWVGVLFLAVLLRFATESALSAGVPLVEALRMPFLATSFGLLVAGLWVNRTFPGMSLAFVGILANAVVILVNGGHMPIWEPSLELAGFTRADVASAIHVVIPAADFTQLLTRLGLFGDVIPIGLPVIRNVASVGDLFLTAGLAFFLFAGVVRTPQELDETDLELIQERLDGVAAMGRHGTGLSPSLSGAVALARPLVLGASGAGMSSPTAARLPLPTPRIIERVRRHPYVRLALNGSFSALWAGQLISLFGDRMHQVALAAVVFLATRSPLATGLVFMVATLPNLLFSPIAGTFVDRWEHKEVLVVSDLLRAAVVLLMPVAVAIDVVLVYPLVFLVTTISIFFRPARVAILPRVVEDDELLTANSALWVAETIADVVAYPLAAVFVASLGNALPLAFWIDAATYLGSAALLGTIVVAPRRRRAAVAEATGDAPATSARSAFGAEMRVGWRFLRGEKTLLANTLQATVAQFATGILIGQALIYAEASLDREFGFDYKAIYGFLETGIGVGNLVGGFVIGLLGARFAKGRMIILGYSVLGLSMMLLGLTSNLAIALGLAFGIGVANMVYVIPSQTLFQERTPGDLIGRVVGFRFALVFGAMTLAMGVGGLLSVLFPVTAVIATFGLVTLLAGLAGLLVPAIRDA